LWWLEYTTSIASLLKFQNVKERFWWRGEELNLSGALFLCRGTHNRDLAPRIASILTNSGNWITIIAFFYNKKKP
jgi:hypothetical protein